MVAKFITAVVLFIILPFSAESANVDSLLHVAQTARLDTVRISAFHQLGKEYGTETKALNYYQDALALATKINDSEWKAKIHNSIGLYYAKTSSFSQAMSHWTSCLKFRKSLKDYKGIAESYNNIGILYKNTGDYSRSLEYYFKSLALADSLDDDYVRTNVYNNISIIYKIQKDFVRALDYQHKSLELARKEHNKKLEASSLLNLGILNGKLSKHDEALKNMNESLMIYELLNDNDGISSVYGNRGIILENQGAYNEALKDFEKHLAFERELKDKKAISGALINIGDVYRKLNQSAKGIDYCTKGFRLADSLDLIEWKKNACECLFLSYETIGDYKNALAYHKKYGEFNDIMYNEENTAEITQKEMRYQFNKEMTEMQHKQERKELEREQTVQMQKIIILFSLIGLGLMIAFSIHVYRNYRNKKISNILLAEQKEEIQKKNDEKEVLIREIHHRVKNNLQIISSLLKAEQRNSSSEEVKDVLSYSRKRIEAMALVHEKLYIQTDLSNIDLEDYLLDICENLILSYDLTQLIQLLVNSRVSNIHADVAVNLGLLTAELLTNSIKHGYTAEQDTFLIQIDLSEESDRIRFTYKDNGRGFSKPIDYENPQSFGIKLILSIIKKLNGTLVEKTEVPNQGFLLIFEFKHVTNG